MRAARLLLVGLLAALLVGCGGDEVSTSTATAPEAASITPADVAFFVSVDTDFDGEQWQELEALLARFPSGDKLGEELRSSLAEEDVDVAELKQALGPEVALAGWELEQDEPRFVLYTKSPDRAKLQALLQESDDPVVTRDIGGWTAAAERRADLDRLADGGDKLADDDRFRQALAGVGEDPLVLAYIGGEALQGAIEEGATEEGLPPGFLGQFGSLEAIVVGASAEDDGARFAAVVRSDGGIELDGYEPSLDETVPAKPLLYVSAGNVDDAASALLDEAEKQPAFEKQRADLERVLGLSVNDDVLPMLGGEVALAVYPEASGDLPVTVDVVLEVDDESKAERVVDRIVALAELSGSATSAKTAVGGVEATELRLGNQGVTLVMAVTDDKLMITTGREAFEALQAGTARLADDDAYKAALDSADAPGEVMSLIYSDLDAAVPFFTQLAAGEGKELEGELRGNLEPLRSVVAFGTADDDEVTISGFVGID